MKKILLLGLTFLLASCFTAPQTRVEFVGKIKQGAGLSSFKTMSINRPLNNIIRDLQTPLKECLNLQTQGYWTRGGGKSSNIVTTTYLTRLKKTASNKAELTMQTSYHPMTGAQPPKGGFYDFAIDFESQAKNKTLVTLYSGMSGQGDLNAAFTRWINGRKADCPLTKGIN